MNIMHEQPRGAAVAWANGGSQLSPDLLLSTKEVAAKFGLGVRYLETARTQGDGPAFIRLGRAVRYRVRDINQWLDSRRVSSTSEDL